MILLLKPFISLDHKLELNIRIDNNPVILTKRKTLIKRNFSKIMWVKSHKNTEVYIIIEPTAGLKVVNLETSIINKNLPNYNRLLPKIS